MFLSLSAMAGMNLSFLFVFLTFLYLLKAKRFALPAGLVALPEYKTYLKVGGILFFACLLSLVVAKLYPIIYSGHAPEITAHGFLKIWYLFCPLVLASTLLMSPDPKQTIELGKKAWWIATLILAVVAVIQFYTGWPLAQEIPTNLGHYHAILFFGHHLSTASIIIFPTFVALAEAIGEYQRTQKIYRFAWATAFAGILILFLSYARAAWVSVPIGIVILFFRYLKPKQIILSLATLAILLGFASQSSLVNERLTNSMGVNDRVQLWKANINFFKANPVTGIGWLKTQEMSEFYFKEKFPERYGTMFWGHAHNNFFEMLGGTGLIGVIAFLLWSIFTFKLGFRASNPSHHTVIDSSLTDIAYGLFVALILLHLNGMTNVTFWEGKVMHQQMLAVAILLVIRVIQVR